MKEVSVVLTSCNRPDLLEKTLDSFFKYNTYPITEFNIIDDSGVVGCNDQLKEKFPSVSFWYNPTNIGQVASIDKMYGYVTTPYVFHMEEDWEFYKEGFIEACLEVIDLDEKIICVWTRDPNDIGHPLLPTKYATQSGISIQRVSWGFDGHWHGFTFNPSLKKMKDYPQEGYKPIGRELELSKYYYSLGYFAMAFTEGYCKHAGWGRHVTDVGETTGHQTQKL
jgi:GT2 family glycosyltransferase